MGPHHTFLIENRGEGRAPDAVFEVSLGPPCPTGVMDRRRPIARYTVPALAVTVSKSMRFNVNVELGEHVGTGCELHGEMDPGNEIFEVDEGNNLAAIPTVYRPEPDLVVVLGHGERARASPARHSVAESSSGRNGTISSPAACHRLATRACSGFRRPFGRSQGARVPWGAGARTSDA